jgi:hypothetical protein
MPPVFRTQKDQAAVTIADVGVVPANGVGGITLERAAESLRELQNDDGQPLDGAALNSAAKAFAKERGLDVADISDAKVEKLAELAGAPADRPPLVEVAQDHPMAAFASNAKEEPDAAVEDPTAQPDAAPEPAAVPSP